MSGPDSGAVLPPSNVFRLPPSLRSCTPPTPRGGRPVLSCPISFYPGRFGLYMNMGDYIHFFYIPDEDRPSGYIITISRFGKLDRGTERANGQVPSMTASGLAAGHPLESVARLAGWMFRRIPAGTCRWRETLIQRRRPFYGDKRTKPRKTTRVRKLRRESAQRKHVRRAEKKACDVNMRTCSPIYFRIHHTNDRQARRRTPNSCPH